MLPTIPQTVPSVDSPLDPDALKDLFQQLVAEHGSLVRAGDLLTRMTNDYDGACRLMLDSDIGDLPVLEGFDAVVGDVARRQMTQDPASRAQTQTELALHWLALQSKESRTLEALVARNAVVADEVADAQRRLQAVNTSAATKESARQVFEHTLMVRVFVSKVTQIAMEQAGMRAYVHTYAGDGQANRPNPGADTFVRLCQAAHTQLEHMSDRFGEDWLYNVPFAINTVEAIAMRRAGYTDTGSSDMSVPGRAPSSAPTLSQEIPGAPSARVTPTPNNESPSTETSYQPTMSRPSTPLQRRHNMT